MKIIPLTGDLTKPWDTVVLTSPDSWFYHLHDEQKLLHEAWYAISHNFLIEDNNQIVGICPIQEHMGNSSALESTILGPAGIALIPGLEFDQRNKYFRFGYDYIYKILEKCNRKFCRINIPPLSESSLQSWNTGYHPLLQFGLADCSTKTAIINLKEIDPKTLQSKIIDNMFFAGEILDIDGPSGGYNLQVAWSTGYLAGQSAM